MPSLAVLGLLFIRTRHCRAGLLHTVPSALDAWVCGVPKGLGNSFGFLPGTPVPGFLISCLRHWGRNHALVLRPGRFGFGRRCRN